MAIAPVVVDRVTTPRGELALRRCGEHYEVISNGTFLMDTRDGRSERLLVTAALHRHPGPADVLIGGMGLGFSLLAAVADRRLTTITVVEIEAAVLGWHHRYLADLTRDALADPRVEVVNADLLDLLGDGTTAYDLICLDVDNGPAWTVTERNGSLYDDAGTELVVSRLRPDGVLSVWSAAPAPPYEALLRRRLERVESVEVPVPRGAPDVVLLGSKPAGGSPR